MSDIKSVPLGISISEPEHPLMVVIGLVRMDGGEIALKLEARGFEESDAGAVDLAEHLEAIAQGVRSRLAQQPVQPKRPRFNPQPRGGK